MISLLDSAIRIKKEEPIKLFELCEQVYPGAFSSLIDAKKYVEYQKKIIILFILYGYTKESDWLIIGREWAKQKKEIAERVELPDTLHEEVVNLKNENVRDTIDKYLDVQKDRTWKHYKIKQDLYETLIANSLTDMRDNTGKVNYKMLQELDQYADKLSKDIKELEDKMKDEYQFCEEAKKANKKAREKGKDKESALENSKFVKT